MTARRFRGAAGLTSPIHFGYWGSGQTISQKTAESMSSPFDFIWRALARQEVGKGAWRMPWLTEAMKDAISCDNRGRGANDL